MFLVLQQTRYVGFETVVRESSFVSIVSRFVILIAHKLACILTLVSEYTGLVRENETRFFSARINKLRIAESLNSVRMSRYWWR